MKENDCVMKSLSKARQNTRPRWEERPSSSRVIGGQPRDEESVSIVHDKRDSTITATNVVNKKQTRSYV